jgi:hypothetical protein
MAPMAGFQSGISAPFNASIRVWSWGKGAPGPEPERPLPEPSRRTYPARGTTGEREEECARPIWSEQVHRSRSHRRQCGAFALELIEQPGNLRRHYNLTRESAVQ